MTSRTLKPRGAHVVIDGPDGVGISTQCDLLTTYLRSCGIACAQTANPSEGPIGAMLRRMLLHKEPALPPRAMQIAYVGDRAANDDLVVMPARDRGAVVVQARGEWSTVTYNAARAIEMIDAEKLVLEAFAWHAGLETPTLTILLVADLDVTEARRGKRGGPAEFFDGSDFQARVIALYAEAHRLAKLDPASRYVRGLWGPPTDWPLVMIDASTTELEVHARVLDALVATGILPALEPLA